MRLWLDLFSLFWINELVLKGSGRNCPGAGVDEMLSTGFMLFYVKVNFTNGDQLLFYLLEKSQTLPRHLNGLVANTK